VSTALPERAKKLHTRLVALGELDNRVKEASLLEGLRSHFEPEAIALSRNVDLWKLLLDFDIEIEQPASLASARMSAATLLDKFLAEKTASTLKRGVGWTRLIERTKDASRDLGFAVAQGWDAYRKTLFTGDAPDVIRERIAFTPANRSAFTEYSRQFQAFRSASERVPSDRAGFEHIRALARALTEAAQSFDFNVPLEVKLFLEAIQRGGAALDMLTDDVSDWLKSNNGFDGYRIVPRSVDGRR
jgi:hypothetical protein